MQKTMGLILPLFLLALQTMPAFSAEENKTRAQKANETYKRLFASERQLDPTDP